MMGFFTQIFSTLFDIVRQEIVINRYNQNVRIKLLNEKVKYFTLAGHRFENITLAEGKDENISNGIYDIVFDNKTRVLVKRFKRIKNPIKAEDPRCLLRKMHSTYKTGIDSIPLRTGVHYSPLSVIKRIHKNIYPEKE